MYWMIVWFMLFELGSSPEIYFRYNLLGYATDDTKMVIVLSNQKIKQPAHLIDVRNNQVVFRTKLKKTTGIKWGEFAHQYRFDFSGFKTSGQFTIKIKNTTSDTLRILDHGYDHIHEKLLAFMRQQRCGYNPYFDVVCHQGDGRLFYAPVPDSTYYDFSGGWHDAGDQLKYLITGSNATARMLKAFELVPTAFDDQVDRYGHAGANGIPDILDEAKWGLEWILKLHPHPDWLIHQIADDRDHRGFKFPDKDNADYGWGPNSYRAAYFADGMPQGLGKWKSSSTGIANIAGRSAAALASGARIWRSQGLSESFALQCETAAKELYALGQEKEGFQQGNSYGAPYRYNEDTWTDDMQWGGAELFKLTKDSAYLKASMNYAMSIKDHGWMAQDSMHHYQKYPFMNMGHFVLHSIIEDSQKHQLSYWYKSNIERVIARGKSNVYGVGVPFLWCSNNLMVNFITQVILYEQMTGDKQYHDQMLLHRDWLFGRNPWGTSMFTGIPANQETPYDVHIPATALLEETPAGGLIDGPIYRSIYNNLLGLTLTEPDEFVRFQNDHVVYHDDIGDYSTNEPTMDGTADAILMMALLSDL